MHTHTTQSKTGGNVSLAAGWWRPVSALRTVSRDRRFDVKRDFFARRDWSYDAAGTINLYTARLIGRKSAGADIEMTKRKAFRPFCSYGTERQKTD